MESKAVERGDSYMGKALLLMIGNNVARMEDEIVVYRKTKLPMLSPSGFSYQLYERYLERIRMQWYELAEKIIEVDGSEEACLMEILKELLRARMEEIIKQDYITLEDYPEDEMVKNIKEYHDFLLNHFRNGYLW